MVQLLKKKSAQLALDKPMKLKEFIKLLPDEIQPTIEPGNITYIENGNYIASWTPVSESYCNVTATWDSLEYVIDLTDTEGRTVRQIGTLNILERRALKRKEKEIEANK